MGSISPMLYEQLLQAQIPKEKDNDPLNDFLHFFGSSLIKAEHKTAGEMGS